MKEEAEKLASLSELGHSSLRSSSCSANGLLWDEIDLAERYLMCAMFEEAKTSATSALRKLCNKASGNEPDWSSPQIHVSLQNRACGMEINVGGPVEIDDMIEAAGMVLMQAYSQVGRGGHVN